VTDYPKLLRDHGLRVTAQRSTLLRLLCEVDGHHHLTAKDLFQLAGPTLPGLNLATVYRTLEGLHEVGLVDRMSSGHDQVHYSFHDPEHRHGHLCCRGCGRVEEFDYQTIVQLAQIIRKNHHFQIDREHLTLAGLCSDCQNSARRNAADPEAEGSHGHSHTHG
jgi:Fur family ferric uptake transcriptional regulator